MRRTTIARAFLASTAIIPLAVASYGQNNSGNSTVLETVVVTAEKHAESSQKAPVQLQVVGGEEVRSQVISSANDLARLVPDIGIVNDTTSTRISIRGVMAESISESVDQAVVLSIDGEYMRDATTMANSMFDLERVEVLKGPQGTLYGRNATAGTLNIITAKPKDEFGGYATAGVGNYGAYNYEGAVNVPITDEFAVRLSGMHTQHNGYENHFGTVKDSNNANLYGARLSTLYKTNRFSAYLSGEYNLIDNIPTVQYAKVGTPSTAGMELVHDYLDSSKADYLPTGDFGALPKYGYEVASNAVSDVGYYHVNAWHLRTKLEYDLGDGFNVAYVGGWYVRRKTTLLNLTGMEHPNGTSSDPSYNSPLGEFISYEAPSSVRDWSNEIHFSYTGDNGLFAQAGAFYYDEDQGGNRSTQTVIPENGYYPGMPASIYVVNNWRFPSISLRSYALFAQADIPITDTIKFTGGLRYSDDTRKSMSYQGASTLLFGQTTEAGLATLSDIKAAIGALPTACDGSASDAAGDRVIKHCYHKDKVNWLVGLEWNPDESHMVYGKISTAFRAGGFDNLTKQILNGTEVGNFKPEQVVSYEIGTKNRFFDGALQVNVSGFYYDYTNLQVDSFINTAVGAYTSNAGAGEFKGVDFDLAWQATDRDRFGFVGTYLDATYTSYKTILAGYCSGSSIHSSDPTNCPLADGPLINVNLDGNKPPMAPLWSYKISYDRNIQLGKFGVLDFDVTTAFKSNYFVSSYNFPISHQESYFQTDLSLMYTPQDGYYDVQLYVHNVENYIPITYAGWTGTYPVNYMNVQFGTPRTFGGKLDVRF